MSAAVTGRSSSRLAIVLMACLAWTACGVVTPEGSGEALGESSQPLPACYCPLPYLQSGEEGVDPLRPPCGPFECELNYCGDGYCAAGEDSWNCPSDCGSPTWCGNAACDVGEDEVSCPSDCFCGDGWCNGETVYSCPVDCGCPNPCGNGTCGPGESTATCPGDCGSACGDGACNGGEDLYTCAPDCGSCGDGVCAGAETWGSCLDDCGFCGDGLCSNVETRFTCSQDCGFGFPCLRPGECPIPQLAPDAAP